MTIVDTRKFENFERAFRAGVSGPRHTCECGITYFDTYNTGYSWEDGEFEALERLPTAKPLDHAVGIIEFEGKQYVDGCTCWHDRAKRLITFFDYHAEGIAEYLSLEKARKTAEAARSPVVT